MRVEKNNVELKMCGIEREWIEGAYVALDEESWNEFSSLLLKYLIFGSDEVHEKTRRDAAVAFYTIKPMLDAHRDKMLKTGEFKYEK